MGSEAIKYDQDKPRLDLLLTPGALEVAKALTHGAKKYSDYNYRNGKGLAYSRLTAATLRHIAAFLRREDFDPESGLHHLAHAGASVLMLLDLILLTRGVDDRWSADE